jgi:membrane associated rhomboid family serine protease
VVRRRHRFDASQLRITRGALIVAGLEVGLSLVYALVDDATRGHMKEWLFATAPNVFEHGRVWTLATSVFVQPDFLGLLLNLFVLWAFVPTLERFWGTTRFYRFVAITSLLGTLAGCLVGLAISRPPPYEVPIVGLSPFIYASIVAFGVVYARQPVQFFGVLPLSGRQLMYGFIGFLVLFVLLGQQWEQGGAFAAAMLGAAVMTSKRWSPALTWRRWRIARARARLSVIEGGNPVEPKPKPRRRDERFLN